ncbi:MAG: single-stranded-DNA-specific exonuclease RecJ [Syntrophomonadaceae bacterium]|nr:single-stranded-DNA-specific exonuclease RecJ [Syntrophomonadaceae bacterium]
MGRWQHRKHNETNEFIKGFCDELKISEFLANILINRGITNIEEARLFLYGSLEDLSLPEQLPGVTEAAQMIKTAIAGGQKIVVYGDYDVDGICSVFILLKAFEFLGIRGDYYIPDRFSEGYGLNDSAVRKLSAAGYDLLITVDCGVTSVAEVDLALELGMKVIITDHHNPREILPSAQVLVNPKLQVNQTQNYYLAGAGVALKLAQMLLGEIPEVSMKCFLDVAALATIADIVPLTGENRIIAKEGLIQMKHSAWPGLRALLNKKTLTDKEIDIRDVGFGLAPCINAAGRLRHANLALELLLAGDEQEALLKAEELVAMNELRKQIENNIYLQASDIVNMNPETLDGEIMILDSEDWHHGVFGITASRLSKATGKAVILVSWEGERGRGTARSRKGIDIFAAINEGSAYLQRFGGHKMAAGFVIEKKNYALFVETVKRWEKKPGNIIPDEDMTDFQIDAFIETNQINESLFKNLNLLKPFGEDNPEPVFMMRQEKIVYPELVGKEKEHLKFKLSGNMIDCVSFNQAGMISLTLSICYHDLAVNIRENHYYERVRTQLNVLDLKPSWLPDYTKKFSGDMTFDMLKQINADLARKKPVALVFPSLKMLLKYKQMLENFFSLSIVIELHGKIIRSQLLNNLEKLKNRTGHIFLISAVFWKENILKQDVNITSAGYGFHNFADEAQMFMKRIEWQNYTALTGWEQNSIVYLNRPSTLQRFQNANPQAIVDLGSDYSATRYSRQMVFRQSRNGLLLTDGCLLPDVFGYPECTGTVYCADPPFDKRELFLILSAEARNNCVIPVKVLFAREALEFNSDFLRKQCPDEKIVRAIWEELSSTRRSAITFEKQQLLAYFRQVLQRPVKWLEIVNIIRILEELNLCIFVKKGSIIEIKVKQPRDHYFDINDSYYFQELLTEIADYSFIKEEILHYLNW